MSDALQGFEPLGAVIDRVVLEVGNLRQEHSRAGTALLEALHRPDGEAGYRAVVSLALHLTSEERLRLLDVMLWATEADEGRDEVLADALARREGAGAPVPPFTTIAEEAPEWAWWASTAELKHYLLATFRALPRVERVRFLAAAQRAALA